jgi:hypothetical protein
MCALFALVWLSARTPAAQPGADSTTLLYADFERMEDNRPVSARGGVIQIYGYEESGVHKSTFKGPELVHIKKDDPNHALKFDYSLRAPNQWAGVVVEIHGLPDVDGKMVPDDVSGFKTLSLQVYATGIEILRLETISTGRGKDLGTVYPLMTFKVRPGFNTYKVPLKGFTQPAWASIRVDPKEVFKSLTSIKLTAFCDQCERNQDGVVIVDNLVFEK